MSKYDSNDGNDWGDQGDTSAIDGYDSSDNFSGQSSRGYDADTARYVARGNEAMDKWRASEPDKFSWGDAAGVFATGGKSIPMAISRLYKHSKWDAQDPSRPYSNWDRQRVTDRGGNQSRLRDSGASVAGAGGYRGGVGGTGSGTGAAGGSIYPTVYTDPITGRLVYQSQSVGNMTNSAYSDQQMLDQIMGSSVAEQNKAQQIRQIQDYMDFLESQGADTTYYQGELARLQGLGTGTAPGGGLMPYLNTGVMEQAANRQMEVEARNQMLGQQEAAGRRGMGVLSSPMNDQLRASLGLSTAMARSENKAKAQEEAWNRRNKLMSFLKQSQQQDYGQEMGRTATGVTMGDWENQRKIAEISQKNTNKQYKDMIDAKKSGDIWGAVGNIAGNIDWGKIF